MGCCLGLCFTEADVEQRQRDKYEPLNHETERTATANRNMLFFKNKIRSEPDGDYIDKIHSTWFHDYERLEKHHGYIQWLFPIKEDGVNSKAQRLTSDEIEFITHDPDAQIRLFKSYKMMANFYGLELVNSESESNGELKRSEEWEARMTNLNRMAHNNLRITRILKSLRLLGFERLTSPLVHFLAREIFEKGTLPNSRHSCKTFWIPTLSQSEQVDVNNYITSVENKSSL